MRYETDEEKAKRLGYLKHAELLELLRPESKVPLLPEVAEEIDESKQAHP